MSESYNPNEDAVPVFPYSTVFLSQRDLGLQIPINYVTNPGVSLSTACFSQLRFEDDDAGDCISNLLAVGFRKLEIDLYWDEGRGVWSFCPAVIPDSWESMVTTSSIESSTSTMFTPTSGSLNARATTEVSSSQTDTVPADSTSPVTVSTDTNISPSPTTLGTALPSVSLFPDSSNRPLVQIGPYLCTATINLSLFMDLLQDYTQQTENTLDAHLITVIIHVHAAVSDSAPLSPPPIPAALPDSANGLGELFSTNLSAYLYTPSNLKSDRTNLNETWYTVPYEYKPIESYYTILTNENGVASTDDGWPTERYIEFTKRKRLLLGFGSVDDQMSGYSISEDEDVIFTEGYMQTTELNVQTTSSGQLTSGCFFNNTLSPSQLNSSWATDALIPKSDSSDPASNSDLTPYLNLSSNIVNCGISPLLNSVLLNASAHEYFQPYELFVHSTIWSWADSQPQDYDNSTSGSRFRCAATNTNSTLAGRWAVQDCSSTSYPACRASGQSFNWTLANRSVSYNSAKDSCPDGFEFAVPRTSLENRYLYQTMVTSGLHLDGSRDGDDTRSVWVDFNSLDLENCWVSGGANATCPYTDSDAENSKLSRQYVLVPTIAAFTILILAALTVFVKVEGNRKVRRRKRRRPDNGFVYEGVPS